MTKVRAGEREGYIVAAPSHDSVMVYWEDTQEVEEEDPRTLERHEDDEVLQWLCDLMC